MDSPARGVFVGPPSRVERAPLAYGSARAAVLVFLRLYSVVVYYWFLKGPFFSTCLARINRGSVPLQYYVHYDNTYEFHCNRIIKATHVCTARNKFSYKVI